MYYTKLQENDGMLFYDIIMKKIKGSQMAKAFLIRWGTQNDFDSIKLQVRELGFTIDNERLYIGGNDDNIHIPNEMFMKTYVASEVPKYKPLTGSTAELISAHLPGALAYDIDDKRIIYKTPSGVKINMASTSDLPLQTPFSVKVLLDNIDSVDGNSVTISGYNRPIEMIFLNGSLCTTNQEDTRRYEVDRTAQTLKVYGCSENDIIAYF